ncbi:MAG: hypothetical protein ACREMQ_12935 [Longimicrobiales bacterium]
MNAFTALLGEARALAKLGQKEAARERVQRVARPWENADPPLRRVAIDALSTGRPLEMTHQR